MSSKRCVYCGADSSKSRSRAHVFPEAILPNGPSLESGIVCDSCNHYLGANLETVLVQYPLIALPLQLAGLPGKTGKARKKLGVFQRDEQEDADVIFAIAPPEFSYDEFGIQQAMFQPLIEKKFDMDRLRRALHHIGFNLLVWKHGIETSQEARYAPLRNYVRRPKRGERWPFAQAVTHSLTVLVPDVSARQPEIAGRELLRIQIFNTEFYIDLLNSDCLLTAKVEGAVTLIGPEWKQSEQKRAPEGVYFRASILKDHRSNEKPPREN